MAKFFINILIILSSLSVIGCKRPESNPENRDPVYQDLLKESAAAKSLSEETRKKITIAEADLARAPLRSIERKNAQAELQKQTHLLQKYLEFEEYYKIRAKRRLIEGRQRYSDRYKEGLPWPDREEFEAYSTNKRLMRASRRWNNRVPKPQFTVPGDSIVAPEEPSSQNGPE